MTTAEAAQYLGLTPRALYRLIEQHQLVAYRSGFTIYLDRDEVEASTVTKVPMIESRERRLALEEPLQCRWSSLISLLVSLCKEGLPVDVAAKMSSKGQLTVPKAVRDALGLKEGDEVVFRVDGRRAVLARTTDFLALAGSVKVPAAKRNLAWSDVLRRTHAERGKQRA